MITIDIDKPQKCTQCPMHNNGNDYCKLAHDHASFVRAKGCPIKSIPKAEKHIDHTDCTWYGSDSGCPVTCSQYRDGWNDAIDYIFNNGKGYRPFRRES